MSFDAIAVNDLVRILAAGAALELNAQGRQVNDLVRLAAASSKGGGLTLTGVGGLPTNDLVRLGAAGGGKVTLKW
ncbi:MULTISPECIES: hypothetical protein [Pseudomonas]|uniref:hypothetical protein n=1 Tax=Pseudomonas TaxID=286 RepID=UPI00110CAFE7|nr:MULTISPECIES: hypothetical protein [Pseudomonas]